MQVVVLASQKGGTGKSTLSASLAVAAREDGETVVIVDLDPQRSLADWHRVRTANDIVLRAMPSAELDEWIVQAHQVPGLSLLVIDTAGASEPGIDVALRNADFCLVPVRPSAFDLRAAGPTVQRVSALGRRFAFVLNAVSAVAQARTRDAIVALEITDLVAPTIGDRVDFRDAVALGLGVTEVAPSGKGAAEIRSLWNWTKKQMKGQTRG
ncbi:ParA family protein [Methylobacterium oxalidis]|uniref:ParA family protein n=1 Tax=Methylobacterium oxalidis TaxID=944322 RepID=UPI003315F887